MEMNSIDCVSFSDGMDEDEIQHHTLHPHHHSEFSSNKPRNGGGNNNNVMGATTIAPATSVHELLECPVCTNSMYPPIHQEERAFCGLRTCNILDTPMLDHMGNMRMGQKRNLDCNNEAYVARWVNFTPHDSFDNSFPSQHTGPKNSGVYGLEGKGSKCCGHGGHSSVQPEYYNKNNTFVPLVANSGRSSRYSGVVGQSGSSGQQNLCSGTVRCRDDSGRDSGGAEDALSPMTCLLWQRVFSSQSSSVLRQPSALKIAAITLFAIPYPSSGVGRSVSLSGINYYGLYPKNRIKEKCVNVEKRGQEEQSIAVRAVVIAVECGKAALWHDKDVVVLCFHVAVGVATITAE
ncbi:E3 ubiquitin-protein ligase SINAT4, partial [Mucuna pruriens]